MNKDFNTDRMSCKNCFARKTTYDGGGVYIENAKICEIKEKLYIAGVLKCQPICVLCNHDDSCDLIKVIKEFGDENETRTHWEQMMSDLPILFPNTMKRMKGKNKT